MTDQNKTHLLMISDRSGSMDSHRDDTQGGINAFLAEHKKAAGQCDLTFEQFDTEHDTVFSGDLQDFGTYILQPRGGTALLDAIGYAVTKLGEKLASLPEDQRPGSVIAVISTDGMENSSREYSKPQIKELLERQQNDYQWQVIFLGANIDAIGEGASMGIAAANSMTFDQSNVVGTYAMAATNTTAYRGLRSSGVSHAAASGQTVWTDEQREEAVKSK